MESKVAHIRLNDHDYVITYHEKRFGACAGLSGKIYYMKVKENFENCYKLYKTLVYSHLGARGAYDWIVLCSHYQTNMDYAEKFVRHIIQFGRGAR